MDLARDVPQLLEIERLVDLAEATLPEHLQDDVALVEGRVEAVFRSASIVVQLRQSHESFLLELQSVQLRFRLLQLVLHCRCTQRDDLVLFEHRLSRVVDRCGTLEAVAVCGGGAGGRRSGCTAIAGGGGGVHVHRGVCR